MPPTPIPPALSKEEWAQHGCIRSPNVLHARDGETVRNGHYWLDVANSEDDDGTMVAPESRHALAALCLYNQPFGFDIVDFDLCNTGAFHLRVFADECKRRGDAHAAKVNYEAAERLKLTAAKIRALLPPTE